ncbi:hypothetical protein AVEN_226267-1 [Araneus ventricosus]|uniref:Uncharacterized protein n=1 Tax=Araneus ventricosus TaxID=182803 RepID=A0A4Y2DB62_ARAVE|nr:hypothetical protein AVEN_226267-1 [Araneus ventricosus]
MDYIPCLELLASTVGARLCRSMLSALQWDNVKQHYWTDYTTMLGWIQREELWNSTSRITDELSHQEIKQAELKIVKMIQDEYFIQEVNRKKLNSLTTYKDGEGILRADMGKLRPAGQLRPTGRFYPARG